MNPRLKTLFVCAFAAALIFLTINGLRQGWDVFAINCPQGYISAKTYNVPFGRWDAVCVKALH